MARSRPTIGVLALQGDFAAHGAKLEVHGCQWKPVRQASELIDTAGLVIPGGESSTLLKLSTEELRDALSQCIRSGMPTLATCAGIIFIAKAVKEPAQESLQLLDIDVTRNAYGRQVDSFIAPDLHWTKAGESLLSSLPASQTREIGNSLEGVFIRAPKISRVGKNVLIVAEHQADPVLVKQDNIIGATFHPELCKERSAVHEIFCALL